MEGQTDPKYFDYSASSPVYTESLKAFTEYSSRYFANPSSAHNPGREAKDKMMELKKEFCDLLNFNDGRLLLCSSGSEANNTIIEGHLKKYPQGKILIAEDTHESIWYATRKYANSTILLPISFDGKIDMDCFKNSLTEDISMVCVNHVCNEIGTIHNISEIANICNNRNIKLLVDGAQAIGHIPLDLNILSFDYYSFVAHKFGGVRSTGGILMRDNDFNPLISGGKQEWNLRAGTENLSGLAAAVLALKKSVNSIESEFKRLMELKTYFLTQIKSEIKEVIINNPDDSLPGFLSLSFPGYSGNEIVEAMSISGFSISSGSACRANEIEPSRIVLALGRNDEEASGTVRITMGYGTTKDAVKELVNTLVDYFNKY